MIRAQIRGLSGRVELAVDDRPIAIERLPRVHTMRERVSRWGRRLTYGLHGLGPGSVSVSYAVLGDAIRIDLPDGRVDAAIGLTKSQPFLYRGQLLRIRVSPFRGRLAIEAMDGRRVALGTYGLSYVAFAEYPKDLEPLLAALAVGFAIRVQWSEAAMVVAH